MGTRLLCVATIIAATSVIGRAQTSRSALEDAVWKADAAWSDACSSNDVDKMLAFYDANAAFIGTTPPTVGVDRLRTLWTNFFARPGYRLTWRAERVEIAASEDFAYSYGPWEQTEVREGTARTSKGTYVAIWKRQSNGTWKVLVDKP